MKTTGRVTGVVLASALAASALHPGSESVDGLVGVGRMHELRASHSATLLPDGRVLIAGGFKKMRTYDQVYFSSAELYDPHAREFVPTGSLNEARCGHTATLLPNGTVLITGGGRDEPLAGAELYDPRSGAFAPLGSMAVPRQGHTATLLQNGNVLIAGGCNDGIHGAEVFNATSRRFESTGTMSASRFAHTATLLPDGRVLIAGGTNGAKPHHAVAATAELYDPKQGTFAITGPMSVPRYKHAAVLLADGNVLVAGGSDERDWRGQYNSAETYDTKRGMFSRTPDMAGKRFKLPNGVTVLPDSTVLISGGGLKIELFEPLKRAFTTVAQFDEPRFYQTATLLADGTVLIAGGYNTKPQSTDKAWLYRR